MAHFSESVGPESWEVARNYASLIGTIPSSFSATVRTLVSDGDKGNETYSAGGRSLALRLLRSPSLFAAVSAAARDFRPGQCGESPTPKDLIAVFKPSELAVLIAFLYVFRRARKVAPADEWQFLFPLLHRRADLGLAVGSAITTVGVPCALIVGAAQSIAASTLQAHDKAGYKDYRRFLKSKAIDFDGEFELGRWGCTTAQIGATIFQNSGFGVTVADAFVQVAHGSSLASRDNETQILRTRFTVAKDWIDSLSEEPKHPDHVHDARYYPLKAAAELVLKQAAQLHRSGVISNWLDLSKDEGAEDMEESSED